MKVIINADDFGYSEDMNAAIEEAIMAQKISSTSIIANAPCFEDAISISQKYNFISYGVHLNIIEFSPLSDMTVFKKYKLIDDNGEFIIGAVFALNDIPVDLKLAIKEEWRQQILKVVNAGVKISHLDSHQHTHTIPALEAVVIDILEEFKIHRVRRKFYVSIPMILRERYYTRPVYNKTKENSSTHKKTLLTKLWKHIVTIPYTYHTWVKTMKQHASMTDAVFIYQVFVQEVRLKKRKYQDMIIELECHPGLASNREETEWLMSDKLRENGGNYQLISYLNL